MESQHNGFRSPLLLTAAVLAALLALSLWGSLVVRPGIPAEGPRLRLGSATPVSLPSGPPETLFSRVFEALSPSVVFLTVRENRRMRSGSGLIVHEAGFIVTNAHVVDGADRVTVSLDDGRDLAGDVWGTDRSTDIAILKVEPPEPLVAAHLGDSEDLKVGEFVMAVGAPFNLRSSVTRGIVSGLNKRGLGLATIERFIVTDAAINRGNSGGPLVNSRGEVVGINTAMISGDGTDRGGFSGVGFAIPIDLVVEVASALIGGGGLTRGYFGVGGMSREGAFLLTTIDDDGPAAAAGLREGDLVVALDGEPVEEDAGDFQRRVHELQPGTSVEVEVVRDGERLTFDLVVGNWPAELELPSGEGGGDGTEGDTARAPGVPRVPGVVQVRGLDAAGHPMQLGSGIVMDGRGRVLTSAHVVRDAARVEVLVPGQVARIARRDATDERIDLALVTVEGRPPLVPARLGDSERLTLGDEVTAVGILDDGSSTGSPGRVLDLGYELSGYSEWVGLILTDARTAEGYSGGPLLDVAGEVVGVLTAAQAGRSQSLAIPIDTAAWAANQLREHGRVVRSTMRMGIMTDMTPGLVTEVFPGGPGDAAGLEDGDRLISANGSDIQDYGEWMRSVARMDPDTPLRLEVQRGLETFEVELTLEEEQTVQQGESSVGS